MDGLRTWLLACVWAHGDSPTETRGHAQQVRATCWRQEALFCRRNRVEVWRWQRGGEVRHLLTQTRGACMIASRDAVPA